MADVAVVRLRLAAPAGRLAEARQRTEDALRLAAGSEQRLLVLRRLALGAMPGGASAQAWAARAEDRLRSQRRRAVHALAAGAGQADAVWFHSPEEAEAALLRLLAAGAAPAAWFWRLAVPRWRGRPAAAVLAERLIEAERDPAALVAVGRVAVAMLAEGRRAALVRWLAAAPEPWGGAAAPGRDAAIAPRGRPGRGAPPPPLQAERLVARLDHAARAGLAALLAAVEEPRPARMWAARLALAAAAPELAGTATLILLAEALVAAAEPPVPLARGAAAATVPHPPPAHPGSQPPARAPPSHRSRRDAPPSPAHAAPEPAARLDPPAAPSDVQPPEPPPGMPAPAPMLAAASVAAGTLLLIRPLWRMGIGERLAARPDLLAGGFGRALLAHIARRMRVTEEDPLLAALGRFDAADPALLTAWRVGLDRWLRRTARITLSEVVLRRGRIACEDERLDVRFRLDAADIRLRRRALDVDPGWVDWLGLSVRYQYSDEPPA